MSSNVKLSSEVEKNNNKYSQILNKVGLLIIVMFVFLVALQLMGTTFKGLQGEVRPYIETYLQGSPIIGLFIGLFVTAVIQSSSTSTSLIVTAIASFGFPLGESVSMAVPMIMGANIGTSITSTIVSLGHVTKKSEFRKAIASATVHDFFNIMVTCILLPLELGFGLLSNSAIFLLDIFHITNSREGGKGFSIMGATVKPVAKFIYVSLNKNFLFNLLISLGLLFFSLRYLSNLLKSLIIGKSQERFERVVFGSPIKSLMWGAGLTAAVQSSSVTTSLMVPLVATNKVSLRRVFPFLLGANIGTTVTALMAAFATGSKIAVAIAFCHLLFNVFGVMIFMSFPFLRDIPVKIARKLGQATMKQRWVGFAYIIITFFVIPIFIAGV